MKRFDFDICKNCSHCVVGRGFHENSEIYGCNLISTGYWFVELNTITNRRVYEQDMFPKEAKEPPFGCPFMLEYIMREQNETL